MKIVENKNHKKIITIIATIVVLVVAGLVTFYFQSNKPTPTATNTNNDATKKVNDINLNGPTSEQVKTGSDTKKDTVNNATGTGTPSETPFIATITAANQNGSLLQIRTLIDILSANGTCELTLSQGTKTVVKTAVVQALANSSTCKGFDVPTSELSPGDWNISLKVTIGTQTSTATKTVPVS